jgi:hypothetical protein
MRLRAIAPVFTWRPAFTWQPPSSLPILALIAVGGALAWTLFGLLVAAASASTAPFWREWLLIQGFFDVTAAIFLGLLAHSSTLGDVLRQLTSDPASTNLWSQRPAAANYRRGVIAFVTLLGSFTTIKLGFTVSLPTRYFMWLTCMGVCICAGFITWHALEVIDAANNIEKLKIKFFLYSPGDTRSLKRLAVYFVTFGLAMTFGYIFSFIGTISPHWTGSPTFVRTVQAFWPTIYVPLCLIVTTYPHLAIHRVIRQEKDRLITSYQEQINSIIGDQPSLSQQDIEKINSLADLIKSVERSPSFALNFPIAIGTAVTYLTNIGSLFISKDLLAHIIRSHLPP